MKAMMRIGGAMLLAATVLTGCATSGGERRLGGADVTRFHLGEPIARGQIAVEPFEPELAGSLEFRSYSGAVAAQLARLGWTVVDSPGKSEQVALIDVRQGSREALRSRPPVTIGIGGGTGGWSSGVGAGASFGVGGGRGGEIVGTMLQVSIKRRSDGTVFWEGRAETEARAEDPLADRRNAVERLADALFRDFPGESGRTISVP